MKPIRVSLPSAVAPTVTAFKKRASSNPKGLSLALIVVILVLAFAPISHVLLSAADGSFSPVPYSSLALTSSSSATTGIVAGKPVLVRLVNRTGHFKTYHWSATQNGGLLSLGEEALGNGKAVTIRIPSRGAAKGTLRIALSGTNVFVTVPILKS
jgi:hypothetical protein